MQLYANYSSNTLPLTVDITDIILPLQICNYLRLSHNFIFLSEYNAVYFPWKIIIKDVRQIEKYH